MRIPVNYIIMSIFCFSDTAWQREHLATYVEGAVRGTSFPGMLLAGKTGTSSIQEPDSYFIRLPK